MAEQSYISVSEYAKKHKISRMQVIRLIQSGKIMAQRVGNNWMIETKDEYANQIGLEKTSSLQKWNKIINATLHKKLNIEDSKDREIIYSRMHSLGLPHERCIAFPVGKFPSKLELEIAVGRLGYPYWISAVPDPSLSYLNRQTKLRIYDLNTGWEFINKLPGRTKYKLIISQYADVPDFKGTALISANGRGIAEFITGDRHYVMTRGFTITDPMIFDQNKVIHFSNTVPIQKQKALYKLVRGVFGHLEFQYGKIDGRRKLTFFDYNDEKAYIEINHIWEDLVDYFTQKRRRLKKVLYGYPASPGKAEGRCIVVHHETYGMFEKVKKGDILISDATTPEMTPIMKKVAAIVTDLGGVTSHAAIVCRELRIPAIVGVGNATETLRTGDFVKVNADKGEIEIIK